MKIQISKKIYDENKGKVRKRNLVFYLPLSFLKLKFVWKNVNNEAGHIDLESLRISFYKTIKNFVKENGHFNIVEVISKDKKIVIKV